MSLPTKANTARPLAAGYGALIEYGSQNADSLYLPLAVSPDRPMMFQTVPPDQADQLNVTENPEDMRPESGKTFSRDDFTGGEGLDFAHQKDADPTRFWDSLDLDVSPGRAGTPKIVKLSHTVSLLRTTTPPGNGDAGPLTVLEDINQTLLAKASNGARVDRAYQPSQTTPTFVAEDPHAGEGDQNVVDLAHLGDVGYAAITTNGIHTRTSGTWAHWSDLTPSRIWGVKKRIIASTGASLYEAAAGAGSTLLKTLDAGVTWVDVCDAGAAILAAATDGSITMFVDQDGTLTEAGTQSLPGERITGIASQFGLVFITTVELPTGGFGPGRFYRGALSGLRIVELQAIREWSDLTPYAPTASRDAVYLSTQRSSTGEIWRYELTTGGISRAFQFSCTETIERIAVVAGTVFCAADDEGLFREDTTYADTGYIISPLADFYNAAPKSWMGARLAVGSIPTDCSVELYYTTNPAAIEDPDHADWTLIITADDDANPPSDTETPIINIQSRWVALKAVLNGEGAGASTPELRAFSIRGVHQPSEEDYQIPVNISDRLEIPGRRPLVIEGIGDTRYEALKALQGVSATVTLLRPAESVKGQIRFISAPITDVSRKGSPTVYANMLVRGQKQ